jgi:hypothetical protein
MSFWKRITVVLATIAMALGTLAIAGSAQAEPTDEPNAPTAAPAPTEGPNAPTAAPTDGPNAPTAPPTDGPNAPTDGPNAPTAAPTEGPAEPTAPPAPPTDEPPAFQLDGGPSIESVLQDLIHRIITQPWTLFGLDSWPWNKLPWPFRFAVLCPIFSIDPGAEPNPTCQTLVW